MRFSRTITGVAREILCGLLLSSGTAGIAFCQVDTLSGSTLKLTIPKGWKAENDSEYVRIGNSRRAAYWKRVLREGHMPWRADPKYVAVTCLWSFGIHDGTPASEIVKRLLTISPAGAYELVTDSADYIIYVDSRLGVPIADRFLVKSERCNH